VGEILETDLGKILSLSKDAAQGADLRKPASFDKLRMLPSYRVIYAEVY
jgi:hypothetical protein